MNTLFNLVGNTDEKLNKQLKQLKDANELLKKENEILKKCYMDTEPQPTKSGKEGMFGKLLSDVKSTLLELNSKGNDSILEFKTFLNENSLFYSTIHDDDIDYLNELNIEDADWNENKSIIVLKQKILERNYKNLIKNVSVARTLNQIEGSKRNILNENNRVTIQSQLQSENSNKQEEKPVIFEKSESVIVQTSAPILSATTNSAKQVDTDKKEYQETTQEQKPIAPKSNTSLNNKVKNHEKNILGKALVNSKDSKTDSINLLQGKILIQAVRTPT